MTTISRAKRFTHAALAGALACALTLAAPAADAQVKGGTLRVRLAGDLTSLDPAFNTTPPERHVLHQVVNTLTGVDDKLHIVARARGVVEVGGRHHARPQAAPWHQVPRRDRLRRGGGQVQHRSAARPGDEVAHEGRDRRDQGRRGGGQPHCAPPAQVPLRRAPRHARPGAGHDPVAGVDQEARQGRRAAADRHGAVQVRRVGARRPHHGRALRRLLGEGPAVPRQDRLPPHPGHQRRRGQPQDQHPRPHRRRRAQGRGEREGAARPRVHGVARASTTT